MSVFADNKIKWICLVKFGFVLHVVISKNIFSKDFDYTIPKGLLFGVATSAFQIEGAWNTSGKGESVSDYYTHKFPDRVIDKANGDIATDFFNRYTEDIKLIEDMGLNVFRFSIGWSRIFPTGDLFNPNRDGVQFYHNVIDECNKKGIIPFVTLYHWDHPQIFEDKFQGWQSEKMANKFASYSAFIFREYGYKVKYFVTLNEPQVFCRYGFVDGIYRQNATTTDKYYQCVHNMLKGHALAYQYYDKNFRKTQGGQIGIVQSCQYYYNSKENDTNDMKAQELAIEFNWGGVSHAIFSQTGDYSILLKNIVANRSEALNFSESKLPTFTQDWIKRIKGSADFFGLNHYTSFLVKSLPLTEMSVWPNDESIIYEADPTKTSAQIEVMKVVPKGLRDILNLIKKKYMNIPVYITENGLSYVNGINDYARIEYHYSYIKEMLKAIRKDKCNVKAYMLWTLMDCHEWMGGYGIKYGLYDVDFKNKTLKRTPKRSAKWLASMMKSRKLEYTLNTVEKM